MLAQCAEERETAKLPAEGVGKDVDAMEPAPKQRLVEISEWESKLK